MGLHSMSPRSFEAICNKMKFLMEICQTILEQTKRLYETGMDMIDDIFLIESPEFNSSNPLISLNDIENLSVDDGH